MNVKEPVAIDQPVAAVSRTATAMEELKAELAGLTEGERALALLTNSLEPADADVKDWPNLPRAEETRRYGCPSRPTCRSCATA